MSQDSAGRGIAGRGIAGHDLVGRDELLTGLIAIVGRALVGARASVLVAGRAGIGKTSLVRAATSPASEQGALVSWGTCVEGSSAPGYWPWTQALTRLVRSMGDDRARRLAGDDAPLLAAIAAGFGDSSPGDGSDRARLLLFDATTRWLQALAAEQPVVVVLDDLQWADESSLAMLDFVVRAPQSPGLCLVGAYRHDELSLPVRERLGALVPYGEHVQVEGLDRTSVHALVERVAGRPVERDMADAILHRTGGHPFFVRELALLVGRPEGGVSEIPIAVRDAIEARTRRLPSETQLVLEASAVCGTELMPDVIARTLNLSTVDVDIASRPALAASILAVSDEKLRFAHDLFRETVLGTIDPLRRVELHQAVGIAMEHRMNRAGDVAPSELARHFTAAIPVDGTARAAQWALAAASADASALAFGEAAGHLRRLRAATADAGVVIEDGRLCDVLLAEADALVRNGSTVDARGLLRLARNLADRCGDPARVTRTALAAADMGARFAARRDQIVRELESALAVIEGDDPSLEAQLTAALARELQHSVSEDRPRARALSERALELGRSTGSPKTLAACLLARHDVLWTPGAEVERAEIAREIVSVAQQAGDDEQQAQGLLLLANALLERGSSAFEAALESCLAILDRLDQPRYRYTAETRRACVALLRGRLDEAAERIETASALGDRIREPDAGNVRMSQRLELVRARGDVDELKAFAAEAVAHWTGAPVHAHAVAAGFLARAGDLDLARHHVAIVVDLGTWRADRSYLWSVFVRELSHAAIALDDSDLCRQLLDDVRPVARSCGVNGAVVAFAGSHAQTAGLLAAALGQMEPSRALIEEALATYDRLGAVLWSAEIRRHLGAPAAVSAAASLRRQDGMWHVTYSGCEAILPHAKGLSDIAKLVGKPGVDIHVLELMDGAGRSEISGEIVDRRALESYRQRLVDLDEELEEASRNHDLEVEARLASERDTLLEEIGRVAGMGGRRRQFANHPAERARKAVTARVRDAINKLDAVMPEAAAHFDRTIVTGTYCRYRQEEGTVWEVESA